MTRLHHFWFTRLMWTMKTHNFSDGKALPPFPYFLLAIFLCSTKFQPKFRFRCDIKFGEQKTLLDTTLSSQYCEKKNRKSSYRIWQRIRLHNLTLLCFLLLFSLSPYNRYKSICLLFLKQKIFFFCSLMKADDWKCLRANCFVMRFQYFVFEKARSGDAVLYPVLIRM